MLRVIEFDLVTKSEANRRGNTKIAQVIHAKEVKAQREAVGAVLRANLTPPPLHVVKIGDCFERVGAVIGMTERNTITVNLTRIAPSDGLDDDNINAALKHVRDEIAAWVLVPNDRDPIFKWSVPPAQEKSAAGVYRVRIEILDKLTGEDRVVRLAETRSEGVEAARRVKRAVSAQLKKSGVYHAEDAAKGASSSARSKAEALFAKATGKPSPTMTPREAEPPKQPRVASLSRDPGDEKSARDLAPCTTCRSAIGLACSPTVPGRMVFGVHVARARAAGLHVPDDDRAKVLPARAPRGPRKLVPIAQPSLPLQRAFVALPWEQPTCAVCQGTGANNFKGNTFTSNEMANDGGPPSCSTCSGIGRAKGRVLVPARRYDGPDEPPTTILVSVPAEHVSRYGGALTLHRHKFTSTTTGPCWLFDERTETT